MGRLTRLLNNRKRVIFIALCLALLSVAAWAVIHKNSTDTFRKDVLANKLTVGVLPQGDFQHVYYEYKGKRHLVDKGEVSAVTPHIHKQYIVWTEIIEGKGQIVLYNILDQATLRLTRTGNNQSPYVWEGRVVWERWKEEGPQIYYYNGTSAQQISRDYDSTKPVLENETIAYAQQLSTKQWRVMRYDLSTNKEMMITSGDATSAWPHFYQGKLRTKATEYFQWKVGFTGS